MQIHTSASSDMSDSGYDSLQTRQTLLSRLRDLGDDESWRRFFDLYWRLLYNFARKSGLDDHAAREIVQDTVVSMARKMPEYHYDPAKGSFRQWLMRITRRRIVDHLRRQYRQLPKADLMPEALEELPEHADAVTDKTQALESAWDEEWERATFDAALARVRETSNPRHFQAFDYCVLKQWPVSKVADTLSMNAAQVYLAKHRVAQAMKRAVRQIEDERSQGMS